MYLYIYIYIVILSYICNKTHVCWRLGWHQRRFKEDVFPCDHDQEINHRLSDHNLIPMESSPKTRTILPDFFSLPKTSGDGDSAIQKKELQ